MPDETTGFEPEAELDLGLPPRPAADAYPREYVTVSRADLQEVLKAAVALSGDSAAYARLALIAAADVTP